jgi:hypothetical protein
LKVAKLYSDANGNVFSDYELVAMATCNAARIIKWDKELGTLQPGKRADLVVIAGEHATNPFNVLFNASEKSIDLVVVNGTPRMGSATLMRKFKLTGELKTIGRKSKYFYLQQRSQDPVVGQLKLAQAESMLKKGLLNIKKLATKTAPLRAMIDNKGSRFMVPLTTTAKAALQPEWVLVLDHNEEEGEALRAHFDATGKPGVAFRKIAPLAIDPDVLVPIALDALTVAGDASFFKKVAAQKNLPDYVKNGLKKLYAD